MENLWVHSLAWDTWPLAWQKNSARRMNNAIFLWGIVHDIGKVVLFKALSEAVLQRTSWRWGRFGPQWKRSMRA